MRGTCAYRNVSKVVLDLETFKALASETRLSVLRALGERRKTLSELSRDLELNKATVHEHLQVLVASGLVKKLDEGRKWIYYELTWRGQTLLNPEASTAFSVLLALSVAAAGGGVAMLGRALGFWWQENKIRDMGEPVAPAAESAESAIAADQDAQPQDSTASSDDGSGDAAGGGSGGSDGDGGGSGSQPDDADSPPEDGSPPSGSSQPEARDNQTASGDMAGGSSGEVALAPEAGDDAVGTGGMFFDDGGWIALALLAAAALFLVMAILIRKRPPRGKANTQTET